MIQPAPESSLSLEGPSGYIENLFRPTPADVPPRGTAVLCHPHPLFGGTMHNKTLYRIAKRLSTEAGIACLRFNFRGVGHSLGRHDNGVGEVGDVQAAIDAVAAEVRGRPIMLVGYSFGAAIGLRAGTADPRVERLVALGTPLTMDLDVEYLRTADRPRLFVQGERDEFGDGAAIEDFVARSAGDVQLHVVPGADHLFHGVEDRAVDAVVTYLQSGSLSV